jgi:hypothetical protein
MAESAVGDGYTCNYCGQFVRWRDAHYCGEYSAQVTIPLDTQLLSRIAVALERIAEAMEKLG